MCANDFCNKCKSCNSDKLESCLNCEIEELKKEIDKLKSENSWLKEEYSKQVEEKVNIYKELSKYKTVFEVFLDYIKEN